LSRAEAEQVLQIWQRDPDLDGVRDPDVLATLPPTERQDWQRLWADVAALLPREPVVW
jgi:hypothetical protein